MPACRAADGSTVTIRPISSRLVDIHVQNSAGESIATVRTTRVEAFVMMRAGRLDLTGQ